jgi:imidazole glycerol-phosphate synthase subunit HisH
MSGPEVVVMRTGTANLASVTAALARLGAGPRISAELVDVRRAGLLVVPGVGTLAAAMESLRSNGRDRALRSRIDEGRPTLAICLGMQLLGAGSEESPGAEGLGALEASAEPFPPGVASPQLGWNRIEVDPGCELLAAGYVYFANSYRFAREPEGWLAASADHGGRFVAALERGAVLACQFHPELSGELGLGILRRWIETGAAAGGARC